MSFRTNRKTRGIFKVPSREDSALMEFLQRHIYSYRDVPIGEFARLYKQSDSLNQERIREKYRSLESGRLARAMDDLHKFVAALDADERELFRSRNPEIMRMVNEFAVVEDLGEF